MVDAVPSFFHRKDLVALKYESENVELLKFPLLTKKYEKYNKQLSYRMEKEGPAMEQREEILRVARKCLGMGRDIRPEVTWLSEVYDRFRQKEGMISKAEADLLLYERISGGVFLQVPAVR